MTDWDDPKEDERWCEEQRTNVKRYLADAGVLHGAIGERPTWHVAPYVSIWAIESKQAPHFVDWWIISGDGPTDFVSSEKIKHPRDAMRAIGQQWKELSEYMATGREHPSYNFGKPEDWPEIAPRLAERAAALLEMSEDDSLWEKDDANE
jgi:hypothetical protein